MVFTCITVDGGWGEWGAWSDCSAPCGEGLRQRRRLCDNPPAVNGGNECPGLDIDLIFCNEGECKGKAILKICFRF